MNNLRISTGQILQLGSYHKSKTVKGLSLNLAEHHMRYLQSLEPDLQLLQ